MQTISKSPRRRRYAAPLLALCASLALAGQSFAAGVIDKVPADAMVVVKVRDLAATSGKVAKLAQQLGLDMFIPQLADPLGSLKQQLNITGGLNDNGELAFVYLDPKGGNENESMLILVPTSDYAALVASIDAATTEGNLTVKQDANGTNNYIADWNGYAAVSPNKALVSAAPTAFVKPTARAAKELTDNDLSVFANFEKIRGPLGAELTKGRDTSKAEMLEELKAKGEVPEKYHPVAEAAFDQVFNAFEAFLRDADAATIGLSLTDGGIKVNQVAEFKDGSYLGGVTRQLKGSDAQLLAGLPATKFLAYGGTTINGAVTNKLIDDLTGPIVAALPADDEELKIVPQYIADVKALVNEVKSTSFGLMTPTGAIGQEGLFQVVNIYSGNADKIISSLKTFNSEKYADLTAKLMAAGNEEVQMKQSVAPASKTVDGVAFDTITTEIVGDSPMANQQRQAMQFIYGSETVNVLVGKASDESVLTFIGAKDDAISQTIASAKAGEAPLAALEPVQAVTGELPDNRIAELYIAVDEIAATALRAANQFGMFQGNVQLPPDLQPIGVTLSTEGSAIETSAYISADLLQALISAGLQASQRAGGGGNDGGL